MEKSKNLVIKTDLNDKVSLEVLESTLGQLSDGIWENSRVAEQFWKFADVKMINGNVCIVIDTAMYKDRTSNGFYFKYRFDPKQIKNYFAKKVRAVVNTNSKDFPEHNIKFNSKCDSYIDYMGSHLVPEVLAYEAYKVYKTLFTK